ncbi:MAG TPA: alpha/beta fold hydrolase [Xanthobacteraceae bacterium]|jgi:pimeloyl-ACP methyl ester carboxylesterase/DNA-binding CsgD family transcriptional regulator|nr:alpha/beta fold hydrolase [Xanthobacteraceae bacterium]
MTFPDTRYTRSGESCIAYQVTGNGSVDLLVVPGFISNLDVNWEDAGFTRLMRRLSAFARVILFDRRGSGLSDRLAPEEQWSLESPLDDLRAVMDAAGSGRAVLLGLSDGAALSLAFAANHPERTRALVLFGGYAEFHAGVMSRTALADFVRLIESKWGTGVTLPYFAPQRAKDRRFQSWWARLERQSASPRAAVALLRMNAETDIRATLARVRAASLVLHRREDAWVKAAAGRHLAEGIRGARHIELTGRDHPIWSGEIDRAADEIEEFITGTRPAPSQNRVLVTMLVARLVAPERLARRLGDGPWRERLEQLGEAAKGTVARFYGESFVAGAEEICARFDGPARAIECALALREAGERLQLELAVGVHTGEVELHDGTPSGYALHMAERISAAAKAGEVVVSGIVTDLVSGSGLRFAGRAADADGELAAMRLSSVMIEQHLEPAARHTGTPTLDVLSKREREVLGLVADGLSNAAIAAELDLSDHTVKRHVANILVKLDLPTRAAAAALVASQRSV